MSFMSGFGEGFSRTFNQTLAANDQRKQDAFRIMYSDFLDRSKEKDKIAKNDQKNINLAKSLVEGIPGLPEGAWLTTYKWLNSGLDQETIIERLKTGKFNNKPSELPAGQINPATPETPAGQETQIQDQTQKIFNPFSREDQQKKIQSQVLSRISELTGLNPDQVKMVLTKDYQSDITPEMIAGAPAYIPGMPTTDAPKTLSQAQIAYDRAVQSGNKELQAAAKKDLDSIKEASRYDIEQEQGLKVPFEIAKDLRKPINEYNTSKNNMLSVVRHSGDLVNIVKDNPAVLADRTANAATWIANLSNDVTAVIGLFDNPEDMKAIGSAKKEVQTLENEYQKLQKSTVGKKIKSLETSRRLLEMKTKIMAYNLGIAYQQNGRAFSEAERSMFTEMAQGGTSPQTFFQNLSILVDNELQRVEDGASSLNNDVSVKMYNEKFPDKAIGKVVTGVYEDISKKPELQQTLDFLNQYRTFNSNIDTETGQESTPNNTNSGMISPQTKEEYDQLPSGTEYMAPDGSVRRKP